ncbi:MAG TPA: glycosyltransferase family A protein [Polyangiaceae bacterium]|nr:glycosyltransferase family A protein [Polyangiaceae bacterium]
MEQRLLVVSPVRNEAAHFERVALAMAAQTRRPDLWLVVDDQSTDATPQVLARLARQLDFMSVIGTPPPASDETPKDRLAVAAPPRAFNVGLHSAGWQSFTHLAKLDGDVELPPDYFEVLLGEFAQDPMLGLAGGVLQERDGDSWSKPPAGNDYHIRGGLKCYSRECLESIGGIQERLAWDAIDEIYARMRGYRTHTISWLIARHHRPTASADGLLRGRARHGHCGHIVGLTPTWVLARSFKVARERPRGLSGAAFLYGYAKATITRAPRVEDPEFRRFVRRELRHRTRGELSQRVPRSSGVVSVAGRGH